MDDNKLFKAVLNRFAAKYPNRKISIVSTHDTEIVYIDGIEQFCITGFSLLYNLKRLTDILCEELY